MRVLVVDDQLIFRRAARAVIDEVTWFDLVGEAESGEQGVELAAALDAQVVLMDLRMPGIDGIEATRMITTARPGTVVILVSTTPPSLLPSTVDGCGAAAFVPKEDLAAPELEVLCRRALAAGAP